MKFAKTFLALVILSGVMLANPSMKSQNISTENDIKRKCAPESNLSNVISFDFGTETNSESNNFKCVLKDDIGKNNYTFQGNIEANVIEVNGLFELHVILPESDGYLKITNSNGGIMAKGSIYSSKDNLGKYWLSTLSDSSAQKLAGTLPDFSLMDNDEIEAEFQETPETTQDLGGPSKVIAGGTISGTLRWRDAQNKIHPLVGAKVKITLPGSWWAGETLTNSSGYYKISFSGIWTLWAFTPDIHIYAENNMAKIVDKDGRVYEKAKTITDMENNGNYTYSYTFSPTSNGDLGKSMMIFAGLQAYSTYVKDLNGGIDVPQCNVIYPTKDEPKEQKDEGAYYVPNNIHLGFEDQSESGFPAVYASWDTLGHEYGHHLQYHYFHHGYYGSHSSGQSDIIPYFGSNGTNDLGAAKKQGMGLAWSESWPTFLLYLVNQNSLLILKL